MKLYLILNFIYFANAFTFNINTNRRNIITATTSGSLLNIVNNNKKYDHDKYLNYDSEDEDTESKYNNIIKNQNINFNTNTEFHNTKCNIFFNGELNDDTCFTLLETLLHSKEQLYKNDSLGNHINLYIQSNGGALLPTLALVDEIRHFDIPIYTCARGYCASAATLLLVSGQRRLMYEHTLMMIHSVKISQTISGYQESRELYNSLDTFMDTIKDIYLSNSDIDEKTLVDLLERESWIKSHDALNYGFVDEIL